MAYNRADDYFYLSAIEIIAARKVYRSFKVTSKELHFLVGLAVVLQLKGRKVISKDLFLDWIGGNRRYNKSAWTMLQRLIEKGCLHRLTYRNQAPDTGNSLAISPYGVRVLDHFYQQVEIQERQDKGRKSGSSYTQIAVNSDCIPAGYTLRTAGRND